MKKIRIFFISILALFLTATILFTGWVYMPYSVMDEAKMSLKSDNLITVSGSRILHFEPAEELTIHSSGRTGIIFYPGARVPFEAYAVQARQLSLEGFDVFLVRMPFRLAVFGKDKAHQIIEGHSGIDGWWMAGHSLGGAIASSFAFENADLLEGMIFLGSYPAAEPDDSSLSLQVISIYGTQDEIATVTEVESAKQILPANALFKPIEGGNHAQFGYYGEQQGDGDSFITREEQHSIVTEHIVERIKR